MSAEWEVQEVTDGNGRSRFYCTAKSPKKIEGFSGTSWDSSPWMRGGGWLIFKLPPAELAVHPKNGETRQVHSGHALIGAVLYLMCDDLDAAIKNLEAKHVRCTEIGKEHWGFRTTARLPGGSELGLYQPAHPTALGLGRERNGKPRTSSGTSARRKRR